MKVWIDEQYFGHVASARIEVSGYEEDKSLVGIHKARDYDTNTVIMDFRASEDRPLWAKQFRVPSSAK